MKLKRGLRRWGIEMTPERSAEMKFYTYLHCKPDGTPFYVGKGCGNRSNQFSRRGLHHQNIVTKYGSSNIGVFVFFCESEDAAFADEMRHIAQLRSDGYEIINRTDGGYGGAGRNYTPEVRKKLSIAKIGNKNALGSRGCVGKTNFLGKHHSLESKMKISATKRGKPWTEARRVAQLNKQRGVYVSEQ